jgi:hypothetical protein
MTHQIFQVRLGSYMNGSRHFDRQVLLATTHGPFVGFVLVSLS